MTIDEGELIARRYWRFNSIGMPVPGFAAALLDDDNYFAPRRWRKFHDRLFQRPKCDWTYLSFALEAEHRQRPITRLYQLRQTLIRIRQPGYDLGPAREIEAAYVAACGAVFHREPTQCMRPAVLQLEQAIVAKKLPNGPAANLVLMRAVLKMAPRGGS